MTTHSAAPSYCLGTPSYSSMSIVVEFFFEGTTNSAAKISTKQGWVQGVLSKTYGCGVNLHKAGFVYKTGRRRSSSTQIILKGVRERNLYSVDHLVTSTESSPQHTNRHSSPPRPSRGSKPQSSILSWQVLHILVHFSMIRASGSKSFMTVNTAFRKD